MPLKDWLDKQGVLHGMGCVGDEEYRETREKSNSGIDCGQSANPKQTHGAAVEYHGKGDGIKRVFGISRFDDMTLQLSLQTYWDGEASEPFETVFRVGVEAFSAISILMLEFSANLNRYKIRVSAAKRDQTG